MKTSSYHRPRDLEDALALSGSVDGARYIAGGTDVFVGSGPAPQALISLRNVEGLAGIDRGRIGGLTPVADVARSEALAADFPVLVQAARRLGSEQIRSVATVGGNLCRAAPCADLAPPLLVLEATVELRGAGGVREVALEEFFRGPGVTVLEPGEILTAVNLPPPRPGGFGVFQKKSRVRMDLSIASVAVLLEADGAACTRVRIAAGSVAPVPMRLKEVEVLLEGRELTESRLEKAAELAASTVMPITDIRSTEAYRRRITGVYVKRGIQQALVAMRGAGEGGAA